VNLITTPTRRLVIAAAWALLLPGTSRAQTAKQHRIAYLSPGSGYPIGPPLPALWEGLRSLGYDDNNIAVEIRYADGKMERLPDLAAELVRLTPEVIIAPAPAVVTAFRQATSTIPIVMANVADPVGAGFITSLAHPGGNITGLANLAQETVGKRLQLLTTVFPGAKRIAVLLDPVNRGNMLQLDAARQAVAALAIDVFAVEARTAVEIKSAFAAMTREHADALLIPDDPVFTTARAEIVGLAASHKLPTIYQSRQWVVGGGLLSYGTNLDSLFRQLATYVDKILKGAKPADLPVEQPTKFELVINLKTAKVLGLTVPQLLLASADEIIE
jgi:putative tryptophan/tyrosine transport system substrate-binding protein